MSPGILATLANPTTSESQNERQNNVNGSGADYDSTGSNESFVDSSDDNVNSGIGNENGNGDDGDNTSNQDPAGGSGVSGPSNPPPSNKGSRSKQPRRSEEGTFSSQKSNFRLPSRLIYSQRYKLPIRREFATLSSGLVGPDISLGLSLGMTLEYSSIIRCLEITSIIVSRCRGLHTHE